MKKRLIPVAVAALALVAAACSDDDNGTADTAAPTTADSGTDTTAPSGRQGGHC